MWSWIFKWVGKKFTFGNMKLDWSSTDDSGFDVSIQIAGMDSLMASFQQHHEMHSGTLIDTAAGFVLDCNHHNIVLADTDNNCTVFPNRARSTDSRWFPANKSTKNIEIKILTFCWLMKENGDFFLLRLQRHRLVGTSINRLVMQTWIVGKASASLAASTFSFLFFLGWFNWNAKKIQSKITYLFLKDFKWVKHNKISKRVWILF